MELRVLKYFVTIAREQNISAAAQRLHLSQPTLSRQIKDMEEKFGKQLFVRGSRKITLTQEGMILRKRAEEILNLVEKTENEIIFSDNIIAGDIYIGTGETESIRFIAKIAKELNDQYPNIHYHIISGDSVDIIEKLDTGLIDFAILFAPVDISKYHYIRLPLKDNWGVLMQKDAPLAYKESITPEDLWDKRLIVSRQAIKGTELTTWLGKDATQLNIVASYNLLYNASLMAEEGLGYVLCLDGIINVTDTNLCFKPLKPKLEVGMSIVFKKYHFFSKALEIFLEKLKSTL